MLDVVVALCIYCRLAQSGIAPFVGVSSAFVRGGDCATCAIFVGVCEFTVVGVNLFCAVGVAALSGGSD